MNSKTFSRHMKMEPVVTHHSEGDVHDLVKSYRLGYKDLHIIVFHTIQ